MTNKDVLTNLKKCEEGKGAPMLLTHIPAGFPSPADDYLEERLDLNELLIDHPAATFFVKVEGESMRDAGIVSGDILVVDRSLEPGHNRIVVAIVNGEFTIKRLIKAGERVLLVPENPDYPVKEIGSDDSFEVWGVVTAAIHRVI